MGLPPYIMLWSIEYTFTYQHFQVASSFGMKHILFAISYQFGSDYLVSVKNVIVGFFDDVFSTV